MQFLDVQVVCPDAGQPQDDFMWQEQHHFSQHPHWWHGSLWSQTFCGAHNPEDALSQTALCHGVRTDRAPGKWQIEP